MKYSEMSKEQLLEIVLNKDNEIKELKQDNQMQIDKLNDDLKKANELNETNKSIIKDLREQNKRYYDKIIVQNTDIDENKQEENTEVDLSDLVSKMI